MNTDEKQHVQKLRDVKLKRLRVLELQAADLGITTPPHISTEIATLRTELEELELKISLNSNQYITSSEFAIVKFRRSIEVELKASYSKDVLDAMIRAIAAIVNISIGEVRVVQVFGGPKAYRVELPVNPEDISPGVKQLIQSLGATIIYKVDLPAESASQFINLYKSEDQYVVDMGVESVTPTPITEHSYALSVNNLKIYFPRIMKWAVTVIFTLFIIEGLFRLISWLFR